MLLGHGSGLCPLEVMTLLTALSTAWAARGVLLAKVGEVLGQ